MPIFEVTQSQAGNRAYEPAPATVDIGIFNGIGRTRSTHSQIVVLNDGLSSDKAIDDAIDGLIHELQALRAKAKHLLGSIKR